MSALLTVDHIQCRHHNRIIVDDLHFSVHQGDIVCLLGSSGCGKTTTLRAIAGLEKIYRGEIRLHEKILSSSSIHILPQQRNIGMVFQENTLFPHLSVKDNIGFGLSHWNHGDKTNRIDQLLALIHLESYATYYPHQLSGGQQQRVALARALAPRPAVILLDEPFSSIDVSLKRQLHMTVKQLLQDEGTTTILVTHDHREAFTLANQIGVMHQGRIVQWDSPYNLYHKPVNKHIANFLGAGHFISGEMIEKNMVKTPFGIFQGEQIYSWPKQSSVDILIRPDDITYDEHSDLSATVMNKTLFGATTLYSLKLATNEYVEAIFPSHIDVAIGSQIPINIDIEHLVLFLAPS